MNSLKVRRIRKLMQTIADLASRDEIQPAYLAEAVQVRPRKQPQPDCSH
jgi:predicted ATPase with chaperone activity